VSIANYSVIGRILTEVQQGSLPSGLVRIDQGREHEQVVSLHRSACRNEAPFATALHFWAHALRAFLEAEGRPDLFEAMATHALCKRVEVPELARGLAGAAARVAGAPVLPAEAGLRLGYRMIDQEVMESWVAEHDDELLAVFWVRSGWLAGALPFDPEPPVFCEPEEAREPGHIAELLRTEDAPS
jgi:hypothetical protein